MKCNRDVMSYKVSVIIVYHNSEKYFERCLNSLFNQTLDRLEYIFVDDGSTDNSYKILKAQIDKFNINYSDIKIISFQNNRGTAEARKVGMQSATGEYIIHCDSDDFMDSDMYEQMYELAKKNDSEIVCSDFYYDYGDQLKYKRSYPFGSPSECLKNWFNVKSDYAPLWNKLIKTELIKKNNIYPFDNINLGEDIGVVVRCVYHAKTISFINKPFYHYCYHPTSITHKNKELGHKNFLMLTKALENYFKGTKEMKVFLNNLKFNIKICDRTLYKNKREWYHLFKECHSDILKYSGNCWKARILWKIILNNWISYSILSKIFKEFR